MEKHYYDRKSEQPNRLKQSNTTTFKGTYGMFSKSRSHKVILLPGDPEYLEVLYGPEPPALDLSWMENMETDIVTVEPSPSRRELSSLIAERKKNTESNLTSWITVALVSLLGLYVFVKLCQLLLF